MYVVCGWVGWGGGWVGGVGWGVGGGRGFRTYVTIKLELLSTL